MDKNPNQYSDDPYPNSNNSCRYCGAEFNFGATILQKDWENLEVFMMRQIIRGRVGSRTYSSWNRIQAALKAALNK